ncbi:unnamed protein product [Owenia fusiformis]|uniref:Uncharacterized protein n=1 Tax=Owenia fusiformis TaxID=6347 RepID=A0A8J1T7A9_OWEFU|nr:unnamed protein product [Owenia fusiformis]
MASFVAKQLVGNQLKSVKGAIGGDDKKDDDGGEGDGVEDPEIAEARREAEERRKEKHRKMEEERETMRQEIRDKYGLKKKDPNNPFGLPEESAAGSVGRKKKTPAELAAEAELAEEESIIPAGMREYTDKVKDIPGQVAAKAGEVTEKCSIQ